jgi:hypothetical protein
MREAAVIIKYDMRERNGKYEVFDVTSDEVAYAYGYRLADLTYNQADDFVDLLNGMEYQKPIGIE